jgi:hypothetical protein
MNNYVGKEEYWGKGRGSIGHFIKDKNVICVLCVEESAIICGTYIQQ